MWEALGENCAKPQTSPHTTRREHGDEIDFDIDGMNKEQDMETKEGDDMVIMRETGPSDSYAMLPHNWPSIEYKIPQGFRDASRQ